MDFRDIHKSKTVRGILIGLGVAVLVLGIFQAGMVAGYNKARFGGRYGDNFERNFIGPREGDFGERFSDQGMPSGHGAVGEIVSITLPKVIVAGPDNLEKIILIGDKTIIREFRNQMPNTDLKIGDHVVVLGSPNSEGQIEAKLIRVLPQLSQQASSSQPLK